MSFQAAPQLLSASRRADVAMEELTKANHSVMKLGGEAVAREATMVELEHQLAHWKEWTNKSVERVNNLDRENI